LESSEDEQVDEQKEITPKKAKKGKADNKRGKKEE